jgi:nitrogen fixation NifU-like protein
VSPNPAMDANELDELYQELIMDHGRRPRNTGSAAEANFHAHGHNPLCGDKLALSLRVENDIVVDVKFLGEGCAISTASASMMTQAVKGKSVADALALYHQFHQLVTEGDESPETLATLGKLGAFAGVRRFPTRVKCASLAWHTLDAALRPDATRQVTTE